MMRETVTCPLCERRLELPAEHLGKTVQCSSCGKEFMAEGPSSVPSGAGTPDTALLLPAAREDSTTSRESKDVKMVPALRSRWEALVVLATVAALIGGAIYLASDHIFRFGEPKPAGFGPPPRKATLSPPTVNDAPFLEQMTDFFKRFTKNLRDDELSTAATFIDSSDFVDAAIREGSLAPLKPAERDEFINDCNFQIAVDFGKMGGSHTVRHVRKTKKGEAGDLVVIAAHRENKGASPTRYRWWFANRGGVWKIIDAENLEWALPLSRIALTHKAGYQSEAKVDIRNLEWTMGEKRNPQATEATLKKIRVDKLPKSLIGAYHLRYARLHLEQHRDQDCLDACAAALRAHPDLPYVQVLKLHVSLLRRSEEASDLAVRCLEDIGPDAELFYFQGVAHLHLGKHREAAACFRKTLDDVPTHAEAFRALLRCVSPDDNRDIGDRFAKLQRPEDHFANFAREAWNRYDASTLEQLAQTTRRLQPDMALPEAYLALAHAEQGRLAPAMESFQRASWLQESPEERRRYHVLIAAPLARRNLAVKAYPQFADAAIAFEALASALLQEKKLADLRQLVRLHGEKFPGDGLAKLYHADLLLRDDKYSEASDAYAVAFAKVDNANLLDLHRANYVFARYKAGDTLGAYRDIPQTLGTFGQLADLCWVDKKADELQKLVAEHRRKNPSDPQAFRPQWRVTILQGKPDDAGKVMQAIWRDRTVSDPRRMLDDFLFDMIASNFVLEAYRHAPDRSLAFESIFHHLLGEARAAELQAIISMRRKEAPMDPLVDVADAVVADHAGDWTKALRHFRTAWPHLPIAVKARWTVRYLHAGHKVGQGMKTYEELRAQPGIFRTYAGFVIADKDRDAFEKLMQHHDSMPPDDRFFEAYVARRLILQEKFDAAQAKFAAAWKSVAPLERSALVHGFVVDLARFGRGIDAYRCVPDKQYAFQTLAWQFRNKAKVAEFERLLEEHAKHHADDPHLLLNRGELHLLKGELAEAEQQFLLAEKKKLSFGDSQLTRAGLVRARVQMGKTVATYREWGATPVAFMALADQCVIEKQPAQLQLLLAAYREVNPNAEPLMAWDVTVLWMKNDYQATVEAVLTGRAALLAPTSPHRSTSESYLVRSLVRLKKFDQAIEEAEKMNKQKDGPQILLVLAVASTGDVARTLVHVDKFRMPRYLIEDCYDDVDLGPILRSDAFTPFRKRYPVPLRGHGDAPPG